MNAGPGRPSGGGGGRRRRRGRRPHNQRGQKPGPGLSRENKDGIYTAPMDHSYRAALAGGLDSRTKLTKTDWSFWSASLAENQADFEALISPTYDYLNQTTARSPFVDSYVTVDVHSDGMHARPVIGGVFIKMLTDRAIWKKWASADKTKVGNWAPLPEAPKITVVVATAQTTPFKWRYTTHTPSSTWIQPDFDASKWPEGPSSFGSEGTPGAVVRTRWTTDDIWLRRQITMPEGNYPNLQFCGS